MHINLLSVAVNSVEFLHSLVARHAFEEFLVVCNDDQLEIPFLASHGVREPVKKYSYIICVKIKAIKLVNYSNMVSLRLAMLSSSKFVVGSSKAKTPHLELKASARLMRISKEASTYCKIKS